MTAGGAGVSDVAQVIGAIAKALPAATRKQLAAMLAHGIAAPSPPEIRGRRLGLVCELVGRGGDGLGIADYGDLRSERASEDWPAASTLIEHFGSWPAVLELAIRLQFEGHRPPVRASHREGLEGSRPYSREEAMNAIEKAGVVVGRRPALAEYVEVRRVLRNHARRTGNVPPRMPDQAVIVRLFGSYREALRSAERKTPRMDS